MKNEIRCQGDTATVYIYDVIGEDFFGGVTARDFVRQIDEIEQSKIDLRINSPGGDVFDANAIYNSLARHRATVTAHIDGLAASAAAYVPMAADRIEIAENAEMMVHNAWMIAIGDADELVKKAEMLRKVNDSIVETFVARTKTDEATIRSYMDETTYFTAEEAVDAGFATAIGQPLKVAAVVYEEEIIRAALQGFATRKAAIPQKVEPCAYAKWLHRAEITLAKHCGPG